MESEITYHHPWLGRVYYRGFPITYFIEENVSFLETAYFLITGNYLRHEHIIEKMKVKQSTPYIMKKLIERIFTRFFNEKERKQLSKVVYSMKNKHMQILQNLFIIHLDLYIGRDTIYVIKEKRQGRDWIETILDSYEYHKQQILNNILKPYEYLKKNTINEEEISVYSSETKPVYLKILQKLVSKHFETRRRKLLNHIMEIEKNFYKTTGKYLNIDFYTPLIIEKHNYMREITPLLFIPRSLGLLAYMYEKALPSSEEDIDIIYKGPINLPKEKFLEKLSYHNIKNEENDYYID